MAGTIFEFKVEYPMSTRGLPKMIFFSGRFNSRKEALGCAKKLRHGLKCCHKTQFGRLGNRRANIWLFENGRTAPHGATVTHLDDPISIRIRDLLLLTTYHGSDMPRRKRGYSWKRQFPRASRPRDFFMFYIKLTLFLF